MLSATGPNASGATKTWTYTYDGLGDRLSTKEGNNTAVVTSTDLQGWPVTSDAGTAAITDDISYISNADGGLEKIRQNGADLQTFGFDTWGLTSSATAAGHALIYTLDPYGRTITRTDNGTATAYAYAGASEDISTEVTSGTTTSYVSGPGGPLATKTGATTKFYLQEAAFRCGRPDRHERELDVG